MLKYTKEQIEAQKKRFEDAGYPLIKANVEGVSFRYFILPQSLEPNLINFVSRMTGEIYEDGKVYGISDSVREEFRPYAVFHEIIEFGLLGIDHPDRCTKALNLETSAVPDEFREEYFTMRRDFFRDLIGYGSKFPKSYTQDDIRQWLENAEKLDKLLKDKSI